MESTYSRPKRMSTLEKMLIFLFVAMTGVCIAFIVLYFVDQPTNNDESTPVAGECVFCEIALIFSTVWPRKIPLTDIFVPCLWESGQTQICQYFTIYFSLEEFLLSEWHLSRSETAPHNVSPLNARKPISIINTAHVFALSEHISI